MVEFALSFGVLVMCILSCIAAAIWSVESSAAVTAAELAARLSVSVRSAGVQANQVDTTKAVASSAAPSRLLRGTMFGSAISASSNRCQGTPAGSSQPSGTVYLCSSAAGTGAATLVTVHVYGCARSVVPVPVIGGCKGGLVVDQWIVLHAPVFQQ